MKSGRAVLPSCRYDGVSVSSSPISFSLSPSPMCCQRKTGSISEDYSQGLELSFQICFVNLIRNPITPP